ncbi:hypothetical protein C4K04_0603 [Pseudomonas chlororaphis]|uniref:Uncharacterized protein n=1 Tax=Pseudomonas chlororaphis TaxID=587753 RepID=A0A3G7TGS2_9PSED|nr:hypothetical protein C4K04_0603 [Pseudomonas chlororaphis]
MFPVSIKGVLQSPEGLFAPDQLPADLPQGYRDSIVKALGIRGSVMDSRPQIPRA